MKSFQNKICPMCGAPKLKDWNELDEEQKFLARKLPKNAEFSAEERKKHRFCERCWFEDFESKQKTFNLLC